MSSTRRTQDRFGASFRKPAAAVVEAAEVAGAAEAAAAEAAAAVGIGDLAAFARPDCFPITLTNIDHHGRVRQGRPGQSMYYLQWRPCPCVGRPAHDGRVGLQPYREMPARELDEGIPVVEEYALHRRAGIAGKVRVLTT